MFCYPYQSSVEHSPLYLSQFAASRLSFHLVVYNITFFRYTDMESEDYSFYQGLVFLLEHAVSELGYELMFSTEVISSIILNIKLQGYSLNLHGWEILSCIVWLTFYTKTFESRNNSCTNNFSDVLELISMWKYLLFLTVCWLFLSK